MTIEALIKRVEKVRKEIDEHIIEEVKREEKFVLELNRDQLFDGLDSKSKRIKPPYTPYTKKLKRFKGQPTNRVTLKDTGDFYRSFFIEYGKDSFEIDAKDSKVDDLEQKYGVDILGLTANNLDDLIQRIKDPFLTTIKEELIK